MVVACTAGVTRLYHGYVRAIKLANIGTLRGVGRLDYSFLTCAVFFVLTLTLRIRWVQ